MKKVKIEKHTRIDFLDSSVVLCYFSLEVKFTATLVTHTNQKYSWFHMGVIALNTIYGTSLAFGPLADLTRASQYYGMNVCLVGQNGVCSGFGLIWSVSQL